jgi:hypothetical protein
MLAKRGNDGVASRGGTDVDLSGGRMSPFGKSILKAVLVPRHAAKRRRAGVRFEGPG